jgi:hypothetical protein
MDCDSRVDLPVDTNVSEAAFSFETFVSSCNTTWCHNKIRNTHNMKHDIRLSSGYSFLRYSFYEINLKSGESSEGSDLLSNFGM